MPARCRTGRGMAGHRDPAGQWVTGFSFELTPIVTKTLHTRVSFIQIIYPNQSCHLIPILINKVAFMKLLKVEYKRRNELRDYEQPISSGLFSFKNIY